MPAIAAAATPLAERANMQSPSWIPAMAISRHNNADLSDRQRALYLSAARCSWAKKKLSR